jgi:hypothetical protein
MPPWKRALPATPDEAHMAAAAATLRYPFTGWLVIPATHIHVEKPLPEQTGRGF